jgi:hypothetical protein
VLIAHHLPKRGAHLVTALAHVHVRNLARRNSLELPYLTRLALYRRAAVGSRYDDAHPDSFSVGSSRQRGGTRVLSRRAGSSGIPWRAVSFEPQRALLLMKWVKAP